MTQIAGLLEGTNVNRDFMVGMAAETVFGTTGVVVSGLAVTAGFVAAGRALIRCTRTNGQTVMVAYNNSASVAVTTSGTTKIWIAVTLANLDDGSANAVDGSGIAAITSGANFPASNYIPLATVTGGVIADNRPLWMKMNAKSADIASAATIDLSTATGHEVHITGSTGPVTSLGVMPAGIMNTLIFDSTPTLTYHATALILPGAANIVAAAGDAGLFLSEGSGNWKCLFYQKANGQAVVATTDINGSTLYTTQADTDLFIEYNATASANRKESRKALRQTMVRVGGSGADGAVTDANLTITGSNNTFIEKNYTSWAAGSVSRTFTVTPTNCLLYIRIQGDADLTNWLGSFSGKGAQGGAAVNFLAGTAGGASAQFPNGGGTVCTLSVGSGSANISGGGASGGGGASCTTSGSNGGNGGGSALSTPGNAGALGATSGFSTTLLDILKQWKVDCGGGGSSGSAVSNYNAAAGSGGNGGGCVIFEVGGNLTLGSSTWTMTGTAGGNGSNVANGSGTVTGGAGGGGGGGCIVFLYNGSLTGSSTNTVTAGSGGTGANGGPNGGAGGAGLAVTQKFNFS